jgi:hypothetical protein
MRGHRNLSGGASASLPAALAIAATLASAREAAADTMDPALARLVSDHNCQVASTDGGLYYNPASGYRRCGTNNAAFARLIAQYGVAVGSAAMHSARTTGYGGFELALEADFTQIDSGQDYWKKGTQGAQDPTSKRFSAENQSPDSVLQRYEFKIKKGFPLGLEFTTAFGYIAKTSIFTVGADVRMSLLEGFRTGIPAILPEITVGGSVRTITGTQQFQLTVVGVDAQISKPIPIAGAVVVTPYVGYQWMRIFGDSGLIDLTPNTDAVNFCGYSGQNTPASPDVAKKGVYDGQPVCVRGLTADFNNTAVFAPVRLTRHRILAGAQLRFQVVKLGAHFAIDAVNPEDANPGNENQIPSTDPNAAPGTTESTWKGMPKQWTLGFDIGAVF